MTTTVNVTVKFNIDQFDDGTTWRCSGTVEVDDRLITVPAGTTITDLDNDVVGEIEDVIGRPLTDDERGTVEDLAYDGDDFDMEFPVDDPDEPA